MVTSHHDVPPATRVIRLAWCRWCHEG